MGTITPVALDIQNHSNFYNFINPQGHIQAWINFRLQPRKQSETVESANNNPNSSRSIRSKQKDILCQKLSSPSIRTLQTYTVFFKSDTQP